MGEPSLPPGASAESGATFDHRAGEVLAGLQLALTALLAQAGVESLTPADLSRALKVDLKLAWKVDRLLDLRAPEAALAYVPGGRALQVFAAAATGAGAKAPAVDAVIAAHAAFESFARCEAGSRKEFDALLASVRQEHGSTDSINLRKSATEAQASLLGLRAEVQFGLIVFRPSAIEGSIDLLNVRGFRGLACLRRNVVWRVGSSFAYRSDEERIDGEGQQPLDELDSASQAPILRAWTSDPVPELEASLRPEGIAEYILKRSEIGASRTVDLTLAEVFYGAHKIKETPDDPDRIRAIQQIRTPAKRLVTDALVSKDFFASDLPSTRVYSTIFTGIHSQFGQADLLPIPVDLVENGGSRKDAWLDELRADSMKRVGWREEDFTRFRFELPYPPIPASVWMEWRTKG